MRAKVAERIPTTWLLILAASGVLCGHVAAYALAPVHVHGDGSVHAHTHGYLWWVAVCVIPLGAILLAKVVAREVRWGTPLLSIWRLAAVQLAIFAIQEGVERSLAGGNPLGLLGDPVLWLGLGAQVGVACLTVGSARIAARARLDVWRPFPAAWPALAPERGLRPPSVVPVRRLLFVSLTLRGPPDFCG